MKYIEGFRDPAAARALVERVRTLGVALTGKDRTAVFMEVCGSHTMAIARYAIREALPEGISLVSGPGCPVCVTPAGYLDAAIALAQRGAVIVTFGDMLHVPGSETTLADCRAGGGDIRVVYSPLSALDAAAAEPDRPFVFLAIGFETTIAPVVSLIPAAIRRGVENLSLLTAFKTIPAALDALLADPEVRIDGLLCPAHVSAIIGADAYGPHAARYRIPCVIAGFEPLDILWGLSGLMQQRLEHRAEVENQYARVVTPAGNLRALDLFNRYLEPDDSPWRGLGRVPGGGLRLRDTYAAWDAARRFDLEVGAGREHPGCRCGDVVKGKLSPPDCPLFGTGCRPDAPLGPCMVSAEGTCAAWFKYARLNTTARHV